MKLIGLVCPGRRHRVVPLKKVDVDVSINDFTANVVSTLEYVNEEDEAIEAEFVFPMDDDSAVYHFEVEIDGRIIIGECQEKKQAKETYEEALSRGHGAFFMSEVDHTGDTFQMKVGNLPSKKKAVVKFSYVIKLKVSSDGAAEFYLPEVLNPRYNPLGGVPLTTGPTISSPGEIPYTLDFKATVNGSKMIQDVKSEHVPIEWDRDETGAVKISLSKKFKFGSDIRLSVYYDNPHKPSVVIRKGNKEADGLMKQDIVMLHFFPEIDKTEMASNMEFIFIVDRSGSMGGINMDHAKGTLLLFLQSLPVGCCFNIISFGSTYDVLFAGQSREYNEESLAAAKKLHSGMEANMGGTELLRPLEHMYDNMKLKEGFSRQVFVLTDGGVSNTRDVIALVGEHANDTRVFAFGIGQGASTALVKGIARVGKGSAEFVSGNERLQSKVVSNLRLAMQPTVMNVKVEWKLPAGVNVVNVPEQIPFIFSGAHTVSYGILQGECPENVQLTGKLTAKCGSRDICESLMFQLQDAIEDKEYPLHRLAAKEQIKILEDKDGKAGSDTEKENEGLKSKILLLSLSTNIVSKYTAFVGVDKETHEVKCHKVEVPVASSPSFGGVYGGRPQSYRAFRKQGLRKKGGSFMAAGGAPSLAMSAGPAGYSTPPPPPSFDIPESKNPYKDILRTGRGVDHKANFAAFQKMFSNNGGSFMAAGGAPSLAMSAGPAGYSTPPPPPSFGATTGGAPRGRGGFSNVVQPKKKQRARGRHLVEASEECMDLEVSGSFEPIIDLQNFDGSWNFTENLSRILDKEVNVLKSIDIKDEKVLATVLAIVWLELLHSHKSDEWVILTTKATQWLNTNNKEGKSVEELKSIAKKVFQ